MNLESMVKYHFPKSTMISDSPRATSPDSLTGTDGIAAMGMTQSRAAWGYSAFIGKLGISKHDSERAVTRLAKHALGTCDSVAALRKLESNIKPMVAQILAIYAYLDYCRSAASVKECEHCKGEGFIEAEKFSMKSPLTFDGSGKRVREVIKLICKPCGGKGVVSSACSDCKGRGTSVDEKILRDTGERVESPCKRCKGTGYPRMPSTEAYAAVCAITDAISLDTWKKSVKPFYDGLATKLEIEEAWAESSLKTVTR
ncbi:antitermination protein [Rouxiella sp. Mn2063]|uniref:antitermination protein Q n=1 Tax=Rouxiella sp. Mn2063 TaxID=3395262 RepID=UPI003BD972DB